MKDCFSRKSMSTSRLSSSKENLVPSLAVYTVAINGYNKIRETFGGRASVRLEILLVIVVQVVLSYIQVVQLILSWRKMNEVAMYIQFRRTLISDVVGWGAPRVLDAPALVVGYFPNVRDRHGGCLLLLLALFLRTR